MEFQGYRLVNQRYEAIAPSDAGQLYSQVLGLFLGVHQRQLRYFLEIGELVPTFQEATAAAQAQAEAAQAQAEAAQAQVASLAAQLRALGVEPEA